MSRRRTAPRFADMLLLVTKGNLYDLATDVDGYLKLRDNLPARPA